MVFQDSFDVVASGFHGYLTPLASVGEPHHKLAKAASGFHGYLTSLASAGEADHKQVTEIFVFALCMYGAVGLIWVLYGLLRRKYSKEVLAVLYMGVLMLTWASTSVGMHVLNKSAVGSLRAPALVAAVQMAMAVGIIGFVTIGQWSKLSSGALGRWMIVPLFFAAMLCSATYTYQYMSLSLITVVRNLTPFIVLPTEYLTMPPEKQPHISLKILGSLAITLVGTVIYAGGITGISWIGLIFAVANMILAVCDRVIQRYLLTGPCKEIPSSVCTVLNNGVGLIPSLALAGATMQFSNLRFHEYSAAWADPMTLVLLIFSGLVGIGICYLGFEVQREVSASSFFVLQNVSKIAVVVVGIVVFGDEIRSAVSVIGLVLSLGGCMLYGYFQMQAAKKPEETPLLGAEKKV